MKRYSETKLDKICAVGFGMIDRHFSDAINKLDELKKEFEPTPILPDRTFDNEYSLRMAKLQREALIAQSNHYGQYMGNLANAANNYNGGQLANYNPCAQGTLLGFRLF